MEGKNRLSLAYGLLVGLAAFAVAFAPLPAIHRPQPAPRVIRVEASQLSYSPSTISVQPGDTVIIQLVSTDVVHGFYVDGYGVSVEADPGQTKTLTFVANRPGSFRIRCNVTCGAMHPFMIGKLNVGPNTTWMRAAGLTLLGIAAAMLIVKPKSEAAVQP